jgi:hypothetical protein
MAIVPFIETDATAFGALAQALAQQYAAACEAAGAAPDMALLTRAAGAPVDDMPIGIEELEAIRPKFNAILEAAQRTGVLDEVMLAELPSFIAARLRALWPPPSHSYLELAGCHRVPYAVGAPRARHGWPAEG